MDYDIAGLFAPNASQQRNQVNPLLTAGRSYEDINRATGIPVSMIRSYADTTRPGYGVKKKYEDINRATGIPVSMISGGNQDAQQIARFDQSIGNVQSALARLRKQKQSASSTISSSYQNALDQLLLSRNQGQKAYDTNKQQTATDFVSAKNTIGSSAGQTLSGILRLLGSRGAGGGSAYRFAAPGAVTREATIQRQGATDTFGRNQQSLDTNWQNFLTGYQNERKSADQQREEQMRELGNTIGTSRADLLQTLADLTGKRAEAAGGSYTGGAQPYINRANRVLDDVATYRARPINYKTSAYEAPDLASYTSERVTPTYQGEAAANDYISPYFSALLGRDRRRELAGA